MLANLRCILVENKKHRAWPALNRLGVKIDDHVSAFIAGVFASHPDGDMNTGNFGETCRNIESKRGEVRDKQGKPTPTERRFQHLLAAKGWDEVRDRVFRMARMAKSQDVPISYSKLEADLAKWEHQSDKVITEWAKAFWTPDVAVTQEEVA
jgi:CRISPR system Cascade subunit CasB